MRGAYCLCIAVKSPLSVQVGSLGELSFQPGRYVYVGSALNGVGSRVRRHLDVNRGTPRATRWHIDHLLKSPGVVVEAVYVLPSEKRVECAIAMDVLRSGIPIGGFGSSDCGCESHLFKVDDCDLTGIGMQRRPLSEFT